MSSPDPGPDETAPPVPDVVEPLGAQEEPPSLGAVATWDWRSGSSFAPAPGADATRTVWEPTPFASFGAAPTIEPVTPAQLVAPDDGIDAERLVTPDAPVPPPAAQPFIALPGAVPPQGVGDDDARPAPRSDA